MIKDNFSSYDILLINQPEIKLVTVEIALMIHPNLISSNNNQSLSHLRTVMDNLATVVHP